MERKVSTLLYSKSLSLTTRRAILANYFNILCKSSFLQEIIESPEIENDLKIDLLHYYKKPVYKWDESVIKVVKPLLSYIMTNTNRFHQDILGATLQTLAAYQDSSIVNDLEIRLSQVNSGQLHYGSLVDNLINIILDKPALFNKILPSLVHMMREGQDSNIAAKLLLDVIYRTYKLHPLYQASSPFRDVLTAINDIRSINDITDKLQIMSDIVSCKDIMLFDVNQNFKALYFCASARSMFKSSIIPLEGNQLLERSIDNTVPLFDDNINQEENLFISLFKEKPTNVLCIPCLYFGKVNSIIIVNDINKDLHSSYVYTIPLAKHLAGAIARMRQDLEVLRIFEKVNYDYLDIFSGLKHDTNHLTWNLSGYLRTMLGEAQLDKASLDSCLEGCNLIDDTVNSVASFSISERETDINNAIKVVCQVLRYSMNRDNIVVTMSLDESLPHINNDKGIKRVIQNLIQNAIKHGLNKRTEERKLNIVTQYIGSMNRSVIKIYDNGPGMKRIYKREIIKKKTNKVSSGYGLTIIAGILAEMGGHIYCSSDKNGTLFEINL